MSRVFSSEMNWSTYQDKQLSVLVSLERSFQSSLNMSKQVKDNLTNIQSAMTAMIRSANSLANYVDNLSSTSRAGGRKTSNARAAREAAEQMRRNLEEAHKLEMQHARDLHESNMAYLEEQVRAARAELEITRQNQRTQRETEESRKTAIKYIMNQVQQKLEQIGKIANNYSESSNNLIKVSGAAGNLVQEARNTIVKDIVGTLNRETNGYFSPLDSYQKMVSIASEASIGSIEALKELTRPILLADASMDANIGELATIFNRFYTRYTFSSASMEDIVNEIRGNTAGNSATAEATVENITKLQNWIAVASRGNTEKMEAMMGSVSRYTSHLESMGVDTGNLTGYMNSILWGDANLDESGLVKILNAAGSSTMDARQLLLNDEDGYAKVSELLYTGIEKVISQYGGIDNPVLGVTWDNAKIDRELLDLYAAMSSTNWKSQGEFLETVKGAQTAVEAVEDKYVSATDRMNNLLERIAVSASNIQEKMDSTFGFGIGAAEVASTIVFIRSVADILNMLRGPGAAGGGAASLLSGARSAGINSSLRGALTAPASMQAATGGLGRLAGLGGGLGGAAMLAGGTVAGAGLAVDGISDIFSSDYGTTGKVLSGVEAAGGIGGAAALLGLGVTNPVGWVALAVGGIALFAKEAHKAATTFGAAEAVEKAYDEAAKQVRDKANQNERLLLQVKSDLERGEDLTETRNKLINSGLLNEQDLERARTANKQGLEALTESYLKANEKWSAGTQNDLNDKKKADMKYAKGLHGNLEELLQTWLDGGQLTDGSNKLAATENLMFELYSSLQERSAKGEDFDKATQKVYDKMAKAFKDGTLNAKEANSIIDSGFFNTHFQNANFTPEELMRAAAIMGATNSAGKVAYDSITKGLGTYYGDTSYDTNLDPGYAVGTNYIDRDQVALLHEGEAIVPKAYNPAANMNELESLREQVRSQNRAETRESQQQMQTFISTLTEIKDFLYEWKADNIKRETINSAKNKYAAAGRFAAGYFSPE